MIKLRAGTRGSKLAMAQTREVIAALKKLEPGLEVDIIVIKTTGDMILHRPLAEIGAQGVFVKELENALHAGEIDFAVHSLKDMPAQPVADLEIAAVMKRRAANDCLLSAQYRGLEHLPPSARIGTSSVRRRAQLLHHRPDLRISDMRGNLDTRLRKLREQDLHGIILAQAGLERLGLDRSSGLQITVLGLKDFLPAPGQGALALECRAGDIETRKLLSDVNHVPTQIEVSAERAFLQTLGGGCHVPCAAYAWHEAGLLQLQGMISGGNAEHYYRDGISGRPEAARELGAELAARMLAAGGASLLGR